MLPFPGQRVSGAGHLHQQLAGPRDGVVERGDGEVERGVGAGRSRVGGGVVFAVHDQYGHTSAEGATLPRGGAVPAPVQTVPEPADALWPPGRKDLSPGTADRVVVHEGLPHHVDHAGLALGRAAHLVVPAVLEALPREQVGGEAGRRRRGRRIRVALGREDRREQEQALHLRGILDRVRPHREGGGGPADEGDLRDVAQVPDVLDDGAELVLFTLVVLGVSTVVWRAGLALQGSLARARRPARTLEIHHEDVVTGLGHRLGPPVRGVLEIEARQHRHAPAVQHEDDLAGRRGAGGSAVVFPYEELDLLVLRGGEGRLVCDPVVGRGDGSLSVLSAGPFAGELADTPVRVQVLCPGVVATEWNSGAGHSIPWAMTPEDVASASLAGLRLGGPSVPLVWRVRTPRWRPCSRRRPRLSRAATSPHSRLATRVRESRKVMGCALPKGPACHHAPRAVLALRCRWSSRAVHATTGTAMVGTIHDGTPSHTAGNPTAAQVTTMVMSSGLP